MVFVADDLTSWLIGLLADAGRKKLTTLLMGTDQERALRSVATEACLLTARELCPDGGEQVEQLAMVINEVFTGALLGGPPRVSEAIQAGIAGQPRVLEVLQAGIARQLAVLDDASLTGTGQSSADVSGVPGTVVTEKLTGHLLREIVARAARGGPLAPLANQLSHDVTHMQGQRLEAKVAQLADELRDALAQLPAEVAGLTSRGDLPVPRELPADVSAFAGRRVELAELDRLLSADRRGRGVEGGGDLRGVGHRRGGQDRAGGALGAPGRRPVPGRAAVCEPARL